MVSPMVSVPNIATRSQGRRARRRAELRTRILRSALDLFARQGFFTTTVEQITEAADVGKGTFFNYFPSKEHALAGFGEMQVARVDAALSQVRAGREPMRRVLRRLAYALAEEPGRSQALVRSLMVANLSSEPVRQLFRHNLAKGRRRLAKLIALGQERGEIRRSQRPAELARLFQQMFLGTMLMWAIHPPSPVNTWLEPTFELFWAGIATRRGGN
jgi:AcrR family transcriptional regulator